MKSFDNELTRLQADQLYRSRREIESAPGATIQFQGREVVNFSSNDYLNLAHHPKLIEAASESLRRYGCGAGSSPLVSGYLPPVQDLERELALWEGCERALVFSSGFATNLAVVSALTGSEDLIFSDQLNHASLIDGCRLSRATTHVYRHVDMAHLESLLRQHAGGARRSLIVTDSLFSMDGDMAPLDQLLDLAFKYDCGLVLDEAHATGVIGEQGRGVTDLIPEAMSSDRVIKIGTLSKAMGAQGGFVCGSGALIEWLINKARPYIFSTGLAPASAAAATAAIQVIKSEPRHREHLCNLARELREKLVDLGCDIGETTSHIIPLIVGTSEAALTMADQLLEAGMLVPAIRPPSVPEGSARLRISLCAGHSTAQVEKLVGGLSGAAILS